MSRLARWELKQAWRSFRIPGFWLLLLFFALMDPPVIKYMEQIVARFGGGIQIQMPQPTPRLAMTQFLQDLTQIAGFVLVLLAAGSLANERGLANWYLAQPVKRAEYLLGKWLALVSMIVVGGLVSGLLCFLYSWSLLGSFSFGLALKAIVGTIAFLLYLASASLLGSALFPFAGAGTFGFLVGFGGFLLSAPAQALGIYQYFPQSAAAYVADILAGTYPVRDYLWGIFSCLVLAGIFVVLAVYFFDRRELAN